MVDGVDAWVELSREGGVVRPLNVDGARVVGVPVNLPPAAQMTELKAAYLIAFAVLGYSWAGAAALDRVRSTIRSGDADGLGQVPLFRTSRPHPDLANTVLVAEDAGRIAVIGDDPKWGVLLPLRESFAVDPHDPALSMSGYALPWLPDRWWRSSRNQPSAFRWDCEATRPMWRVDVIPPGT